MIHIKLGNLSGSSTDKNFSGWSSIYTYAYTTNRPRTSKPGTSDFILGDVSFSDLYVRKKIDALPSLQSMFDVGRTLIIADSEANVKITFSDARVVKRHRENDYEEIHFSFSKIEEEFTPKDSKNNSKASVKCGYDLVTMKCL
tara:strand:- start:295 stop:723 length:429 start_codon:yes stop_codon:yes gene_type:complete